MLIYEVNLTVEDSIADEYEKWFPHHIEDVIACPGFTEAKWYVRQEGRPGFKCWTTHYYVRDQASLDAYLTQHAPKLREDVKKKFGERFTATRRVLEFKRSFL